jgi:hypothetical protein
VKVRNRLGLLQADLSQATFTTANYFNMEIEMPLSKEIQTIQEARYELAESNRIARKGEMFCVGAFIKNADLQECLWVINELIERVSTLTGCASELEDAACVLIKEMENQE